MDCVISSLSTKFAFKQGCITFAIIVVIKKHTPINTQSIFLDYNPNFETNSWLHNNSLAKNYLVVLDLNIFFVILSNVWLGMFQLDLQDKKSNTY